MNDELVRYLREHRATYTREALTAELLAAGHAASDVDAAWAQLDAGDAAAAPVAQSAWARPDTRPYVRGVGAYLAMFIIAIVYLGSIVVFNSLLHFCLDPSGAGNPCDNYSSRSQDLLILYAVAMLAGAAYVIRRMSRASEQGAIAAAFVIGIVIYVGLGGACFGATLVFGG